MNKLYLLIIITCIVALSCKKESNSQGEQMGYLLQYDLGGDAMGLAVESIGDGKVAVLYQNKRNDSVYSGVLFINDDGSLANAVEFRNNVPITIPYSIMRRSGDFLYLSGSFFNNQRILKTDLNGNTIWETSLPDNIDGITYFTRKVVDMTISEDQYMVVLAQGTYIENGVNIIEYLISKLDQNGNIVFDNRHVSSDFSFPNLRTPRAIIEVPNEGYWFAADYWASSGDTLISMNLIRQNGAVSRNNFTFKVQISSRYNIASSIIRLKNEFVIGANVTSTYPFLGLAKIAYPSDVISSGDVPKFASMAGPHCLHLSDDGNIYMGSQIRNEATGVNGFAVLAFDGNLIPKWEKVLDLNSTAQCLAVTSYGQRAYATGYSKPERGAEKRGIVLVVNINKNSGNFE